MSGTRSSLTPQLLIPPGIKDITKFVQVNRVSDYQYEGAGVGGSADIFRGKFRSRNGSVMEVAIKCIRAADFDGRDPEYEQNMKKKLARELEIWRTLSAGTNIIQLLGTMSGIGPMPALVCQLCAWNLQDYLERKTPPPKHIQMMTDTLKGLSYMHELQPSPIAHGDVKSHNILVTADEKALICDFGRSRLPHEQSRALSGSSPFGATPRYMSPELLEPGVTGPTSASDMWAYGCVALEILCRIVPYHDITSDFEITELIKQGRAPSDRPRGARASLISDALWATISSCWREQSWRPTSRMFLERLTQMLNSGEVSASPILMEMFPLSPDGPLLPWPEELVDLNGLITIEQENGMIASSLRSSVWMGTLSGAHRRTNESRVVIKVPRLNAAPNNLEPHNHLQHVIRKTVKNRYGVRHQNVIDLLGLDSTFSPHAGLVLEYCARGNLTAYCKQTRPDINATDRPSSPLANAYSLISDILEALQYLHNFPVPITQGDLTPDNILVSASGIAKIGLFSFGRMISAIPAAAAVTSSAGPLLPFRWMSPELLTSNSNPTTESDMWSMGCVSFWVLTGLRPYAGHLRDDFAGVESVRGLPPGSIERIDRANTLGERMIIARESSWITNGTWSMVSKCWTVDPLQRPSARVFLSFMKGLSGRGHSWMPVGVKDLAGKVERGDPVEDQLWMYRTVWKQYESGRLRFKEHMVHMVLVKTNHKPNWYTKTVPVAVKQAFSYATSLRTLDDKPYIASIRHEIVISAQLNHPNICKLIGVDSSFEKVPSIIFEYCSEVNLDTYLIRNTPTFQESASIVKDVASALAYIHEHPNGTIAHGNISEPDIFITEDGRAKLTNFSCSFQYIMHESRKMTPLSSITSTRQGASPWRSPEYYKDLDENHVPLPTMASDIWAFACVIVNTFTKQAPFFSYDDAVTIAQLNAGMAPYSAEQLLKLDGQVLPIVQKMLAFDVDSRPLARDVLKVLAELLH